MKHWANTNKILTAKDIQKGLEQDKEDERINNIARNGNDGEHYAILQANESEPKAPNSNTGGAVRSNARN